MPHPDHVPALPRRTALAGVAAVLAAAATGCTADDSSASRPRPRVTRTSDGTNPDVRLAATVLAGERELLSRVEATLRRHRTLAPALRQARAGHRAHVRLLARAVPDRSSSTASASASPAPAVPAKAMPALAALAHAEQQLVDRHQHSAVAARSGAFARVVAVMAAAAAQQAAHLTAAAEDRAG